MPFQAPRVESVPRYRNSSGQDAIDLAAVVGIKLDEWQQHVLRGALGERSDGKWSAFEVAIVVPRQNGKGEILLARQLAGLFLLGEQMIMHSAHEYKTAAEAFLRIKSVIENNDELRRLCKRPRTSHGEEGIELLNGNRLRFVARSKGSGRGFASDCVILDEAYELGPEQMAAMLPTLSARPNPQLWYASSAGMESSVQLRAVRERGISGNQAEGLAYYEWSADSRADADDLAAWAEANPALGIRISEEFVRKERAAMPEVEFGRERLGIWDDSRRLALIPFDIWEDAIDRASQPAPEITLAIDVTPDRSAAAIGMASRRLDGTWHVEVIDSRHGTAWLVDRVIEVAHRWAPKSIRLDPAGPAGSFVPVLTEAGLEITLTTARELGQACGAFYDAVMGGRLHHIDQTPLTAAVHMARQRPLGDAWAWHRKDASTDLSPLVAVTLAMFGHAQELSTPKPARGRGRVIVLA